MRSKAGVLLVIDDELAVPANEEISSLRLQITSVASAAGLDTCFTRTGEEAMKLLESTEGIAAVMLDKHFEEECSGGGRATQKLQGRDILLQIVQEHPRVPVVMLTVDDSYTQAERFLEAGADRYVVKSSFRSRVSELTNFLLGLREDPANESLVLHLITEPESKCELYVTDESGRPVLKRSRQLTAPLAQIILGCAENDLTRCVDFPEQDSRGAVKGLEPFNRIDIQKAVYAFNRGLVASSEGRMQPLLRGGLRLPGSIEIQSVYGRSAFTLMIGHVEIHEAGEARSAADE
jgi:CheY-like chemotaxis protein